MSWCGGGEIRPTPGVEWRTLAMVLSTLWPGSWPPSPGLAPCAILICIMSELTRYSVVTPKRPDATCLIAERIESPFGSGLKRSASSPPSPVFDLPPIRFMAMASVVCASREIEPNDIAPVAKRLTMFLAGSTSSIGTGLRPSSSADLEPEQAADGEQPLGLLVRDLGVGAVLRPAGCRAPRAAAPRPWRRSRHGPRRGRGTGTRRRRRAHRGRSARRRRRRDGGAPPPRRSGPGRRLRCGWRCR